MGKMGYICRDSFKKLINFRFFAIFLEKMARI